MSQERTIPVGVDTAVMNRLSSYSTLQQRIRALWCLAKPGIVMAELVAAVAGMLLASPSIPEMGVLFWTTMTISLAAAGAAMVNGLLDAAGDRMMPRLDRRSRALRLVGKPVTLVVALIAMGTSLVLAVIFLNPRTALLLGTTIIAYLLLYTAWQKRLSPWGVLAGGIPGALPPLIGAAAVGSITVPPLILAMIIYVWQVPHFWFLALQYQDQYRLAGVPVFPQVYGERLTGKLILWCAVLLLPLAISLRAVGACSTTCVMIMLITGAVFLAICYMALRNDRYRAGFIASLAYLAILLMALITDIAMHMR